MVKTKEDLTGQRFGRWKVLKQTEDYVIKSGKHYPQWLCECQCEKKTQRDVLHRQLTQGRSQSCGCLQAEITRDRSKKYNEYDLTGEYGIGYTTKGEPFWFDLEDYDRIKNYCWHYDESGYVRTTINRKHLRLHRYLMCIDDENIFVDHKKHPPRNEHKIDNRKSNLRIVTPKENVHNSSLAKNNTSGITGVYWVKDKGKWKVDFPFDGKNKHVGYYSSFNDAVKKRKRLEEKYFGEYSYDYSQQMNEQEGNRDETKQIT